MLAYFDCFSGISGDMTLGALLHLGIDVKWLKKAIASMPLDGFDIAISSTYRSGIRANLVEVRTDGRQKERNFAVIKSIIEKSPLSENVRATSIAIFEKLANAEAEIHGCRPREVHFHEVGGIDAIVDIVGTSLCLENLGITKVIASPLPLGKGFVSCRHGKLPVPAPATVAILKGIPVYGTPMDHELVTPTGAAIIATLAQSFEPMPYMTINKIGYGAGGRDLDSHPNLLRVLLAEQTVHDAIASKTMSMDAVWIVETCIDDMNPEMFGFLMDRLFADGALDVYWIPIYMKKNRPGTLAQILCHTDKRDVIIRRILSETTSLGVRFYEARRQVLVRDKLMIPSSFGEIAVKRIKDPMGNTRLVPEYDVCKKIALEKKIPLRRVYDTITAQAAKYASQLSEDG
jgi:uncharacterized protein (TIGR00299 family) protein